MPKITRFTDLILDKFWLSATLLGIGSLGLYLLNSQAYYRAGYPLDDAWIHQTYARNLAAGYGWTFVKGVPSGGSTSPLWTILISLGYFLRIPALAWTSILGGALLIGCGYLMQSLLQYYPQDIFYKWLPFLFLLEWHFVWAALSGMETILGIFMVIALFVFLEKSSLQAWGYGILLGMCVWIRPDLITLIIPVSFELLFRKKRYQPLSFYIKKIWKDGLQLTIPLVIILILYFGFNKMISGNWLPTTFYAKQAEYASLRMALPYWRRFLSLSAQLMVGVGVAFIPAFGYALVQGVKKTNGLILGFVVWMVFYIGLYAHNLAVTYQHGRYMMPALAAYYMVSLKGMMLFWGNQTHPFSKLFWVFHTAWKIILVLLFLGFYLLGGKSYADDVAFIESQMVDTAKWVSTHTPKNNKIAVHDIGAMGYFSERDLMDLGGLIDPAVIPFIGDEERLADYLAKQKADILVCFPGWYPKLTHDQTILYQAPQPFAQGYALGVMTVYKWNDTKMFTR
ncbi:MAG: hypothetical protein ACPL0B_01920 [Anaerolineales bacterium]